MTYTYRQETRRAAEQLQALRVEVDRLRFARTTLTERVAEAHDDLNATLDRLAAITARRDEVVAEVEAAYAERDTLTRLVATLRTQAAQTPMGALYLERFGRPAQHDTEAPS